MTDRVKALRTLLRIRERRTEALEAELAQARANLAKAEADVTAAMEEEATCAKTQADGEAGLDDLTRNAFTLDELQSLRLRVEEMKSATAQAGRAVGERRKVAERFQQPVATARAAVDRHLQRLQGLRDQVAEALREREAQQEEQAEEEAEEAAAGRYAARLRAARAEAAHV